MESGVISWHDLPVPRTNVQLYNLLKQLGYQAADVQQAHRVYGVAMRIYSGRYQGDGTPILAHGVGTAGILAHIEAPASLVAAAIIHNAYTNSDLGVSRHGASPAARKIIREEAGPEVEAYVHRFRITDRPGKFSGNISDLRGLDREVHTLLAAETLEKMADEGIAYWTHDSGKWLSHADASSAAMHEIGYPQLARWLEEAAIRLKEASIDPALKTADRSFVTSPPSMSPKASLLLRRRGRTLGRSIRGVVGRALRRVGLRS